MGQMDDDNDNNASKFNRSDLTNLEDLGFFIHEESGEFPATPQITDPPDEPPKDLPTENLDNFDIMENLSPVSIEDNDFADAVLAEPSPFVDTSTPEIEATAKVEDFSEVKSFGENIAYGSTPVGGNPPFSLMLQNLDRPQDREEVLRILRDHQIIRPDNEAIFLQSIEKGSVLVSQISEFAAVYLAHQLRHLPGEIFVGLADELHPSKFYPQHEAVGVITKDNLLQNVRRSDQLPSHSHPAAPLLPSAITVTKLPFLEGKKIEQYGEILTAQLALSDEEYLARSSATAMTEATPKEEETGPLFQGLAKLSQLVYGTFDLSSPSSNEKSRATSSPLRSSAEQEQLLINQLQVAAAQMQYNGIVSLHFREITNDKGNYQLVAIGNGVVWSENS